MTRLFDQQSFGSGGANFWIGQVVDDSTWRDNVNPKLHEKPEDIKGWGYRYKVRIFGNQTKIKTDEEVPDELLAMAEVLYPVTAGSGQAGSRQTPNLRQGNFVLGFYKDGLDSQQPVIMGAIATNDNTILEGLDPEDGFMPRTGTDGLSGPIPVAAKDQLLSPNGSDKPVREGTSVSIAAISDPMQALAGNETTALKVADKNKENELDTIQIIIKNLLAVINRVRAASSSFFGASTAPFRIIKSEINKVINLVASFIKSLIQKIRGTVITALNNAVKDFVYFLFPNQRPELEQLQVQATDTIGCVFNKIIDGLVALVKGFLEEFIQNNVNAPLCAVEGAVGKLLNNGLVDVADALNSVLGPIQGIFAGIEGAANVGGGLSGGIGGIIDQIAAILQFLSCDETQQHPKIKEWSPWAGIKATTPASSPLLNLIAGVNLGGAAPACNVGPSLAAPPALVAIGGNALVDAVFNPIVSAAGEIIAVDIVNPGVGYQAAPTIVVTATNDQGVIGGGAVLQPVVQNGAIIDVVVKESGSGFLPASNGTTVGAGNVVFSTPGQTVVFSKPPGPRISGGTTLNSSFSVPSGASIPSGTFIPSGTTLPTDLVLPEGSGGTPFFVDTGESGLNQTQRVLEGEAGFEALGVGGVGGDQANVNGLPAFLGGSGTPISGGLGGLFDSPNEELVLDPETGEEIDPGPETPRGSILRIGRTRRGGLTFEAEDRILTVTDDPTIPGILTLDPNDEFTNFSSREQSALTSGRSTVSFNGDQLSFFGSDVRVTRLNPSEKLDRSVLPRIFIGGTGTPLTANGEVLSINGFPVTTLLGQNFAPGAKPLFLAAEKGPNFKGRPVFFDDVPPQPKDAKFVPVTLGGEGGLPLTVGGEGGTPVTCEGLPLAVGQTNGLIILTFLGTRNLGGSGSALDRGTLKTSAANIVSAGGAAVTIGGTGGIPVLAGATGGVPVIAEGLNPDGTPLNRDNGFTFFEDLSATLGRNDDGSAINFQQRSFGRGAISNVEKPGTQLRAGAKGGIKLNLLRAGASGTDARTGNIGASLGSNQGQSGGIETLGSLFLNFGQSTSVGGDRFRDRIDEDGNLITNPNVKNSVQTFSAEEILDITGFDKDAGSPLVAAISRAKLNKTLPTSTNQVVNPRPSIDNIQEAPVSPTGDISGGTELRAGATGGTPVIVNTPLTAGGVPITAGGVGGELVTSGGSGGVPVTVGGVPVKDSNGVTITAGGVGGVTVTAGGVGGTPAISNNQPISTNVGTLRIGASVSIPTTPQITTSRKSNTILSNSNQNLLSVGGTGGTNLTIGGSGGRRASINGSPISVGGKGGTILTVGGPGGTPVTAGAQPVTLGAIGGAPVKVGATGGRVITANRQPVTVGATGGKVVTAASRTNARKIASISKTPVKNPETGQFEITDETPITIGGTGGIPLTIGADGADPVTIGGFSITTDSSKGRPLSSGGSSLTVARKEVILTEGTTLTEDLIVPFGNFIPEGSIISSGTTIPFDIELTTILDLPKQLIDAIQAEPFSNSLEPGDVDGLLEFGYNAYSPNKTVRVKPGDQISAPFGTTSEILDNLGNVIDTIIGKGQTVPITVKNAGNFTTPEPILETDNKKIIGEEPSDGLGRYPAVLAIKDVAVLNNGINYSNTDEITVTPDNGAKLEPVFDNFGKLIDVNVIDGGLGFKEMPKVIVKSKTGINAKIAPVFDVIRLGEDVDESFNVPAGTPIVKVIDCVGQVT